MFHQSQFHGMIHGFKTIPKGDEYLLQLAIGPVSVSIDASSRMFDKVQGDMIYYDPYCSSHDTRLNQSWWLAMELMNMDANIIFAKIHTELIGAIMAISKWPVIKTIIVASQQMLCTQ